MTDVSGHAFFASPPHPAAALPNVALPVPQADALHALVAASGAWTLLPQFGVIDAIGPDAMDFLHNQLTNDVSHLTQQYAALGGLCSPKGRLIASFLYWQLPAAGDTSGGVRLALSADIREAIQKRLSMFILRSKVKLHDVSSDVAMIGLSARHDQAAPLQELLANTFQDKLTALSPADAADGALPLLRARQNKDGDTLIRLSDAAGYLRYIWVTSATHQAQRLASLAGVLTPMTPAAWDWLDVRSGEPRITLGTQDLFVPQMINFEAIGGVSFRKGCYPGQEVVARSQYRGTVKRRARLGHTPDAAHNIAPGTEIFDAADPLQPCGHIVNIASAPGGGSDILAELRLSVADDARLHIGSAEGVPFKVLGLPYTLPSLDS